MSASPAPVPFGRYLLHRRIARGGMAEVFLATIAEDPIVRLLALKRILPQFSDDSAFVRMFLDEVRIAGRLDHPNLAMMHECGQVDGVYYLTMDFVAGVNLRVLVRRGHPIPPEIITTVGAGVAGALEHAHSLTDDSGTPLGLVHRDVTPHNVMVSFDGEVKLLDFGIAKARTQAERTRSGILKGKYAYMSPEQIRGQAVDRRSDIFALGAVMYEALTGVKPFAGSNPLEILRLVTEGTIPSARTIRQDLAPELDRIVLRALERDPARRYQSCGELEVDLRQFLADRSKVLLPQTLASYIKDLFPERWAAVQTVAQEVERRKGRVSVRLVPSQPPPPAAEAAAPPAPFEDLADDLDEQAPTTVWQKGRESVSVSQSKVVRRQQRRRGGRPVLVALAIFLGVVFGVGLGLGLWYLVTGGLGVGAPAPVARPIDSPSN